MTKRTDPYGRGDQPEEPKLAIHPMRPMRRFFWWMFLCDVADGAYETWTTHDDRCAGGFFQRMGVAATFTIPWLLGGLLVGWVSPAVGGVLFVLFWPTRVWIRMALGLRSSADREARRAHADADDIWREDPTYEAWKDRFCR